MVQPSEKMRKKIRKFRNNITESSLNTYITSLRILYNQYVDGDPKKLLKPLRMKFLKDFDTVKKIINLSRTENTKKNRLTAILVGLQSRKVKDEKLIDKYQEFLKEVMVKVNKSLDSQEKTDTQEKNWLSVDEINDVLNKMLTKIKDKDLFNKKKPLTKGEYLLMQKWVLLRFYSQKHLRNNVADTKVITPEEYKKVTKDENYLTVDKEKKEMKFYLNKFKNVKRIGKKVLEISPELFKVLQKWFKINDSGFLFTKGDMKTPLTPNGVTKMLNSIFKEFANGKKISTSLLRHINISEDLKGQPSIEEKRKKEEEVEQKYQHSSSMNDQYRKI